MKRSDGVRSKANGAEPSAAQRAGWWKNKKQRTSIHNRLLTSGREAVYRSEGRLGIKYYFPMHRVNDASKGARLSSLRRGKLTRLKTPR